MAKVGNGIELRNEGAGALRLKDLVTTLEIADMTGLLPNTVHQYRQRPKYHFPAPEAVINGVPVWTRRAIKHWIAIRPGSGYRSDLHGVMTG